jgi:hypothetical protein
MAFGKAFASDRKFRQPVVHSIPRPPRDPYAMQIHQWAEQNDLNVLLASIAQHAAVLAEPLWKLAEAVRRGKLKEQMPFRPAIAEWTRFYHRRSQVWRVIGNKVSGSNLGSRGEVDYRVAVVLKNHVAEFVELIKLLDRRWLRRKLIQGFRKAKKTYHRHLLDLRQIMHERADTFRADLQQQMRDCPELHFGLRVALPCFVKLETSPGWLLRAATKPNPDVESIENLIRLDRLMRNHPKVEAWIYGAEGWAGVGREEMAATWDRDGLGDLELRKFKIMMGGLIAALAEKIAIRTTPKWKLEKHRMDKPTIRRLFDAVARDSGISTSCGHDPDLKDMSDEAWAKSVGRQKDVWMSALWEKLDKKQS